MAVSSNSIEKIFNAKTIPDLPFQPIVQTIKLKSVPQHPNKLRVTISDGKYFLNTVVFSGSCYDLYASGVLKVNSLVKLIKYIVGFKNENKYYLVVEIEVLPQNQQFDTMLGAPQDIIALFGDARVQKTVNREVAPNMAISNKENPNIIENNPQSAQIYGKRNNSANDKTPVKRVGTTETNFKAKNEMEGDSVITIPISSLTPYQLKWTIKARVEFKSAIRTYQNSKGEGKLFNLLLADSSGEIRVTAFNEVVDSVYNQLEIKKTYFISGGTLKVANKQFSKSNNDYEMTFNSFTTIKPCFEDLDLPDTPINITSIESIVCMKKNQIVDVLGYVIEVGEVQYIKSKARDLTKREITIADSSQHSIVYTLWGDAALSQNICQENVVILAKGAKVSEYKGFGLTSTQSSVVTENPDIPEALKLKNWFKLNGSDTQFTPVSTKTQTNVGFSDTPFLMLYQINSFINTPNERNEYVQIISLLEFLKTDNIIYKACSTQNCLKKMIEDGPNSYRCEKCNKNSSNYLPKLCTTGRIVDSTSFQYVTFFNEQIEKIVESTAQEIDMALNNDRNMFDEIMERCKFKRFVFKLRLKLDSYQDETRIRCTCVSLRSLNISSDGRMLIENIKKLTETC